MAFADLGPVQLWDFHEPVSLDDVVIEIDAGRPQLPVEVKGRVNENWQRFCSEIPGAQDNSVAFLKTYGRSAEGISASVFQAGFRYNQWLNRDDAKMRDSVAGAGYNPLASWVIAICDNGKSVLFGNKKDFGSRKVSGFGGFTSQADVVDGKIDPRIYMKRKLGGELGSAYERVTGVSMVGLNFYPTVGPKGFDGIYVAELDGTADQVSQQFEGSRQFAKQLIAVSADPTSLLAFLEGIEWEPTRSCVGGVLGYIGSRFGRDELRKTVNGYSRKELVTVFDEPVQGDVGSKILNP